MTAPSALLSYASEFNDYSSSDILVKTAYIRKRKGRWFVLSEKGKSLGDYATKDEAVKRLRQVEYFKHHPKKKKASKEEGSTYSSIMRDLTKKGDEKLLKAFMETFKTAFDAAYVAGDEHPEKAALEKAKQLLDKEAAQMSVLIKRATDAINLGDPMHAGQQLASIARFMLAKISPDRRQKAIQNLKRKVYFINEFNLASKKAPNSAAIGQAITLIKTMLLSHPPNYIREVLNTIARVL